jgi:DNA-binding NarL/FixJ family response regulator
MAHWTDLLDNEATTEPQIKVVVADDHAVVRDGVVYQLERQPDIQAVGTASTGSEALEQTRRLQPDVLLLDMRMPGMHPVELVQQVRALPAAPAVLMFTGYDDVEALLQLLQAGALGYILKDERPAALVAAIRTVAQGQRSISTAMEARLVEHSLQRRSTPQVSELTARERAVLRLLVAGKSNQDIGDLLGMSERTVRFHLRNMYDKLGVTNRSAAIIWAVQHHLTEC